MQITKQTNPNECGICAINSLVDHYYHHNDKNVILNEAKLTSDGLSIFNFEVLSQKFGLFAETYQLEWTEFYHLKHTDYFVCPIKKNGGLHYVIIKKHKQFIEVYDSELGHYESSYQVFNENFAGIIILITKAQVRINVQQIGKMDLFKHLDIKYLLVNLLIQILIVGLGAITADFMNIMINHVIVNNSLKNGILIITIFGIFYLLNGLMHYLLNLYTSKYFKINFQYLSNELIVALNHKKKSFLNKVDANYFYIIDTAMHSIANFIVVEISSFCANVLLIIVAVAIISTISWWFLVIGLISAILSVGFCFAQYHYRKHLFKVGLQNQRINNRVSNAYIMYLKTQTNFAIKSEIKQALQSNYHEFQRIYIDQTKFISALEFLETIGVNILYMALVMVGCYLIVEKQTLNIGQLIFLISLSVMMSASFNNTCGFVIKQIEYKQMVEIYQNFINIGNATSNGTIVTTDIRSIKLISDGKETMLSNGQRFSRFAHHYIDTITLDVENDHKQLLINDINVKELDYESYTSLIFTFNSSTKVSAKWIIDHFDKNNKIFVEAIGKFKVNLTSNIEPNVYQQTLINVLACLLLKEKLIILDDCFRFTTKENFLWIKNYLIPHVVENNYVLNFD